MEENIKKFHTAYCRGFPNQQYLTGDIIGGACTCNPKKEIEHDETASCHCGCDCNLECEVHF